MSTLSVPKFCAICVREKQTNGKANTTTSIAPAKAKTDIPSRHKYGNLPAKRNDDYYTQVTEPHWLRRGNLKESDVVCKRHLAILMRGVDRGCEGGCCSPLHRGARIIRTSNMKSIPPAWRNRFMTHPKIKDEDKSLMMLCWDCYKKHIDRMSKYGDPMGRSFGNKSTLQRSNSLHDTSDEGSVLKAMKRYKSMDKLDGGPLSVASEPFSGSSSNVSPRHSSSTPNTPRLEKTKRFWKSCDFPSLNGNVNGLKDSRLSLSLSPRGNEVSPEKTETKMSLTGEIQVSPSNEKETNVSSFRESKTKVSLTIESERQVAPSFPVSHSTESVTKVSPSDMPEMKSYYPNMSLSTVTPITEHVESEMQKFPPTDPEIKSSPSREQPTSSRRTGRGRKSSKGRRSPSPPNNFSPVRTNLVSRRKHSPHSSKSPLSRPKDVLASDAVAQSSPDLVLSTRLNITLNKGDSARDPSPDAPVPPEGLFSSIAKSNRNYYDLFDTQINESSETQEKSFHEPVFQQNHIAPETLFPPEQQSINPMDEGTNSENLEAIQVCELLDLSPSKEPDQDKEIEQAYSEVTFDGSTTSADEMAKIFGHELDADMNLNHIHKEESLAAWVNGEKCDTDSDFKGEGSETSEEVLALIHDHDSSGSSIKTGDTQITVDSIVEPSPSPEQTEEDKLNEVEVNETGVILDHSDNILWSEQTESHLAKEEGKDCQNQNEELTEAFSSYSFKDSVFLSPKRTHGKSNNPKSIAYAFSPQSFRQLEATRLMVPEEAEFEGSSLEYGFVDVVREFSHPMRNDVLIKLPSISLGDESRAQSFSFVRVPAEDVEIFPDTRSFLDGMTQCIGTDIGMASSGDLQIVKVNLQKNENEEAHRTKQYAIDSLVVRRGQSFEIELELNENYIQNKQNIILELMSGEQPRVSNNTHIILPLHSTDTSKNYGLNHSITWSLRMIKYKDNVITLAVTSPPTCPVGCYTFYFQTESKGRRSRWSMGSEDESFIVLFNPWCIDDAMFMNSQADRNEYVLMDTGCIYAGNKLDHNRLPWIYGQYEENVLEACLQLLNSCDLAHMKRGDPVTVTNSIARYISHSIAAKPVTKFEVTTEGVHSSVEVMSRYLKTGILLVTDDNVAITALLATVFRCLGIPARTVTCFEHAVRMDLPLTVNMHFSEDGHLLDFLNTDSIWPSYTWTDAWMSRVDLPPGFGGWQTVLASGHSGESIGPVPVYAIKKGHTSYCEGAQTLLISLNADKKYWIVSQDGSMKEIKTVRNAVGTCLVTKALNGGEPQDITKLYKFSKNSEESKLAIHTAYLRCGLQDNYMKQTSNDLQMTLSTSPDVVKYGNNVDIVCNVANNGHSVKHLTIHISPMVLAQDGSPVFKLQRETILAEVLARENVEIPVAINLAPCLHKLFRKHHLSFSAFAIVKETSDYLVCSHLAKIEYPDVEIQVHGEFKVGGEVTVSAKIRNPLPCILRSAKISFSANGLTPIELAVKSGKTVGPWQTFKSERVFRCNRVGRHTVVAFFKSDHMRGPVGVQDIEIS